MSERKRFIRDLMTGDETMTELCERYGVSRNNGYKWRQRFLAEGPAGLEERSRARRHHPNATPDDVELRIRHARLEHPTWGPKKLIAWLKKHEPDLALPAPSTVGELLKRAGLSEPRGHSRRVPRPQGIETAGARPNALWRIDHKGYFDTKNGTRCVPLTLTDHYSRYLLGLHATTSTRFAQVRPMLLFHFSEYGLPDAIRSDNGAPFASRAPGGLSAFGVLLAKLGIRHERIEPGHPEQNGRHERMHRTLKAETASPPAETLRAQQAVFRAFQDEFNHERPHEALEQRTPAELYTSSARPFKRIAKWATTAPSASAASRCTWAAPSTASSSDVAKSTGWSRSTSTRSTSGRLIFAARAPTSASQGVNDDPGLQPSAGSRGL
jgi:transposase InsO family protein